MTHTGAYKAYREWFALRLPVTVRLGYLDNAYGLFVPGPKCHTILLDPRHCTTPELLKGTLLHELIHAEQYDAGMPTDHGAYFQDRQKELVDRTGLPI